MTNIFTTILKLFIGIFIGISIEIFTSIGLPYVVQQFSKKYLDPAPFALEYPLAIIFLLGIYFVFWKKQYALTIGLVLGFVVFMLIMTFLFEVLAGPASL
jgi:hypothetical protein